MGFFIFRINWVFYKCKFNMCIHFSIVPYFSKEKRIIVSSRGSDIMKIKWLYSNVTCKYRIRWIEIVMSAGLGVACINEETILRGLVAADCYYKALPELYNYLVIHVNFYARQNRARKWARKGLNAFYFFLYFVINTRKRFGINYEKMFYCILRIFYCVSRKEIFYMLR